MLRVQNFSDGLGPYTINSSGGLTSAVVPAGYYTFNGDSWNNLELDFQNYDYEATFEIIDVPANCWIYFFWNNVDNATHSGDMCYSPNSTGGNDSINVNQYGVNDTYPYTIHSGSGDTSGTTRCIMATYRFRGFSQNVFTMTLAQRNQFAFHIGGIASPVRNTTFKINTTYYTSANNANWAPTSLRLYAGGVAYTGKMTWRRINKSS